MKKRTLKPATEMREYAKKQYVSRKVVLDKIHEEAEKSCSYTSVKGSLKEEFKKELTDAGDKVVEYISDRGYYCTEISWED